MSLKERILEKVSEIQIYEKYIGKQLKLGKVILSPLRDEKQPSFNIYRSSTNGKIYWKDFGDERGDCFEFVMKLFTIDFKDAVELIANDFNIDKSSKDFTNLKAIKKPEILKLIVPKRKVITTEVEHIWTTREAAFWLKLGVSAEILQEYDLTLLKSFTIKIEKEDSTSYLMKVDNSESMIFCYNKHGHKDALKIYRPFVKEKRRKFTSNLLPTDDVFGLEQVVKAKELINEKLNVVALCAGEKDCLSLYGNTGIRGICLNSESSHFTKAKYLSVMDYCKNLIVIYDNDKTGKQYAQKIAEDYNIPVFDLSTITTLKDTSDYFEAKLSKELFIKKIQELCP